MDPASGAPLLKFKARLTARGDLVDPSRINPDQLNAPTIDPEMVRVILALVAAEPNCRFIQSDINLTTDWQIKASVCGEMGYFRRRAAPEKNQNNYLKNTEILLFGWA